MAGGEGSRLRPLTCTLPKPMARIFGKPILEYIFDLLIHHGIRDAAVTLGYLPHIIENAYEDGYRGLNTVFIREDEPLGTAGGVKNAAADFDEPFLVISGDAICDFDIGKITAFHKASGAMATIVAVSQSDPREYGLLRVDGSNRVTGFLEKPAWSQSVTDLANTGVYIIDPECLKLIPRDRSYDFARDLFPLMLERDMPVYCYHTSDYWCDVGSIEAYMQCQRDIFDGKVKLYGGDMSKTILDTDESAGYDFTLVPPVYIGENAEIGENAVIGPYTVIDDNAFVGARAHVRYSTLLENCWLGADTCATGALVCSGAALKRGAALFEGSVAGAGSVIGENAEITPNVLIWPGKVVGKSSSVNVNVKYGNVRRELISDGGRIGGGARLSAEVCAALGAAVGSTHPGKKTGIAYDGSGKAKAAYYALLSGLMSSGASVWDFGECFETQLEFLVNFCGLGSGIFVSGGDEAEIRVCAEGGLSVSRGFERSIEAAMTRKESGEASEEHIKDVSDMSGMRLLYKQELMRYAPYGLRDMAATVFCDNKRVRDTVSGVLKKAGVSEGGTAFYLSGDGRNVTACENGTDFSFEKLLAVCCLDEMRKGRNIAVPYDAPRFLDDLARQQGKRVFRYLSSPSDHSDSTARRLAARQYFVRDALFLTVKLLSVMKERECSLALLAAEVPDKTVLRKNVPIDFSPVQLARAVGECESTSGSCFEGVRVSKNGGKLLIIPERGGGSVRILAEADNAETAAELCAGVEEALSAFSETEI